MGQYDRAYARKDGALGILDDSYPGTNQNSSPRTRRDRTLFQRGLVPAVFGLHTGAEEVVRGAEGTGGGSVGGCLGLPRPGGKSNKVLP